MRKYILALFITGLTFSLPIVADQGFELADRNFPSEKTIAAARHKLPKGTVLSFNHIGVTFPGESIDMYLSRIETEYDRINILNLLEKNTILYGMLFLGNPDQTMTVLDAGCGIGGGSILIHDTFGCHVDGVTLSSDDVDYANLRSELYEFQEDVKFYQGDLLQTDKADQSYDCIFACESTEKIQDLGAAFTEFARVAKPNARLVIVAWCYSDADVKKQVDGYYDSSLHTVQDYITLAEEAGWTPNLQNDLTDQTAIYWNIRASGNVATNAEKFISSKFSNRDLLYYLFTYEKN